METTSEDTLKVRWTETPRTGEALVRSGVIIDAYAGCWVIRPTDGRPPLLVALPEGRFERL